MALADAPYVSPGQARMKQDVSFLAADGQGGRGVGTKGIEAAADYIASSFREAGLKPAKGADNYFQPFPIRGDAKLVEPSTLAFKGPDGQEIVAPRSEMSPLGIGDSGSLSGVPVAFVGYGITARDARLKLEYDDYAGIDVKGKAVLLLRREPQMEDEQSRFGGKQTTIYATLGHKMSNAAAHGAVAVLMVNDKAGLKGADDLLLPLGYSGSEAVAPLPFVMITRALADKLLEAAKMPKLETAEAAIDADLKPRSQAVEGWTLSETVKIDRKPIEAKNVVAVLEGQGPMADETIVVGAHYDHLGSGGPGSLAFFSRNEIHNGADDNASGTAMILELARRLGRRTDPLPRRVVFIAFSGEERGLLGSFHYVEKPLYPLDQTVMMVNFDMVGRLNDKAELTMIGTGSSSGLGEIADALGSAAGFKIKKVTGETDGFGGSDHMPFYRKKIPVLFPFTGIHNDYHKPSDDTERINFPGMARIADFGELLLLDVARRPSRPVFAQAAAPSANPHGGGTGAEPATADPARMRTSAYLGTVPDYGGDDIKGVKLADVRPNGPAAKGGIKPGDVIIKFAGQTVTGINGYTEYLGASKPGDNVDIVVLRDGKEVTLKVTIGTRPGQ
jgi:hypothetical protein